MNRLQVFKLQKAIKEADDPINATNTYFGQNDALTLDTRDTTDSDKVVDGVHNEEELDSLRMEGIAHKQQKTLSEQHPRIEEIRVISQSLAFSKATARDAVNIAKLLNTSYNKGEVMNPIESFREDDCVDVDTVRMMIDDVDCEVRASNM